jgi:hypothetical protein
MQAADVAAAFTAYLVTLARCPEFIAINAAQQVTQPTRAAQ